MTTTIPSVGDRVVFVMPYIVTCDDEFTLPVGETGTVVTVDPDVVAVRMDDEIPMLASWDNEVYVPTDADDGVRDLDAIRVVGERDLLVFWEMGDAKFVCEGLVGPHGETVYEEDLAENWNGWLVPVFTLDQISALARYFEGEEIHPEAERVALRDGQPCLVVEGEYHPIRPRTQADGLVVYPVDGWTWDVAETA